MPAIAWCSLTPATGRLSVAILTDTDSESSGRTVVFQNDGSVMRIGHLVDTRTENVEKPHVGQDPYIL